MVDPTLNGRGVDNSLINSVNRGSSLCWDVGHCGEGKGLVLGLHSVVAVVSRAKAGAWKKA